MPPVARHNEPVILFVTLPIRPRGAFLANAAFQSAFLGACGDADAWSTGWYVIMPDHVHLFCSPAREPRVPIKRWCGYLKERITKRLHAMLLEGEPVASRRLSHGSAQPRPPGLLWPWRWQSDCWDTQMRNGAHYHDKWEYARLNPVRAGLALVPDAWPWRGKIRVLRW